MKIPRTISGADKKAILNAGRYIRADSWIMQVHKMIIANLCPPVPDSKDGSIFILIDESDIKEFDRYFTNEGRGLLDSINGTSTFKPKNPSPKNQPELSPHQVDTLILRAAIYRTYN